MTEPFILGQRTRPPTKIEENTEDRLAREIYAEEFTRRQDKIIAADLENMGDGFGEDGPTDLNTPLRVGGEGPRN